MALARSGLEVVLFELCEAESLPLPELNARVAGWDVDALWRERVVVEADGPENHRTPAQMRRDRRKELDLRDRRPHRPALLRRADRTPASGGAGRADSNPQDDLIRNSDRPPPVLNPHPPYQVHSIPARRRDPGRRLSLEGEAELPGDASAGQIGPVVVDLHAVDSGD